LVVHKQTLRRFHFLRRLADAELARLARHITETHHSAQTILFPDQQVGDTFYLLKAGRVEIFKTTEQGAVVLNVIESGHYFGEMSLLDNRPRSAAARAATDVTVPEIPKAEFLTLIQRFPFLLHQAARVSDDRLRQRDQSLIAELQIHNQQLRQLYDTSLDISRHRDLDAALAAIGARAPMLLSSSDGKIYLFDDASRVLRASPGDCVSLRVGLVARAFTARAGDRKSRCARTQTRRADLC
jgi:CRP-like cAMP-binding protein